jgi:hypothetical protein
MVTANIGTFRDARPARGVPPAREHAPMTNTIQITPFMHVRDLEAALAFVVGTLGFTVRLRMGGDYAYVDREGAGSGSWPIPTLMSSRAGGTASLIISTFATSTRSTPS